MSAPRLVRIVARRKACRTGRMGRRGVACAVGASGCCRLADARAADLIPADDQPPTAIMIELAPEPEAVNIEENEISKAMQDAEASAPIEALSLVRRASPVPAPPPGVSKPSRPRFGSVRGRVSGKSLHQRSHQYCQSFAFRDGSINGHCDDHGEALDGSRFISRPEVCGKGPARRRRTR